MALVAKRCLLGELFLIVFILVPSIFSAPVDNNLDNRSLEKRFKSVTQFWEDSKCIFPSRELYQEEDVLRPVGFPLKACSVDVDSSDANTRIQRWMLCNAFFNISRLLCGDLPRKEKESLGATSLKNLVETRESLRLCEDAKKRNITALKPMFMASDTICDECVSDRSLQPVCSYLFAAVLNYLEAARTPSKDSGSTGTGGSGRTPGGPSTNSQADHNVSGTPEKAVGGQGSETSAAGASVASHGGVPSVRGGSPTGESGGSPAVGGDRPAIAGGSPVVMGDHPIVGGGSPTAGGGSPVVMEGSSAVGGGSPAVGGGSSAVGGGSPVVGGDHPVVGGDRPVVGGDHPAVGGGSPAAGGGSPVVGGDRPVVGEVRPTERGGSPVLGAGSPAMGGVSPVVGGDRPVVGEVPPIEGGGSPVLGGGSPAMGGGSPAMGGGSPVVGGGSLAVGGDRTAVAGGSPAGGGGSPVVGEGSPAGGPPKTDQPWGGRYPSLNTLPQDLAHPPKVNEPSAGFRPTAGAMPLPVDMGQPAGGSALKTETDQRPAGEKVVPPNDSNFPVTAGGAGQAGGGVLAVPDNQHVPNALGTLGSLQGKVPGTDIPGVGEGTKNENVPNPDQNPLWPQGGGNIGGFDQTGGNQAPGQPQQTRPDLTQSSSSWQTPQGPDNVFDEDEEEEEERLWDTADQGLLGDRPGQNMGAAEIKPPMQKAPAIPPDGIQTLHNVVQHPFEDEAPSGHFMAYFITAVVLCVAGYVIYHNKQKIFAIALEGRRDSQRRRPASGGESGSTAKYSKLQTTVEEVVPALEKSTSSKNYIY